MSTFDSKEWRKKKRILVFKSLAHFMFQDWIESEKSIAFTLIVFTFTMFTYLTHILFNTVIHTDLVAINKPYVPYSYQDIINNRNGFIQMHGEDNEVYFNNSAIGSIERKFSDSIQDRIQHEYEIKNEDQIKYEIANWVNNLNGEFISIASDIEKSFHLALTCSIKSHADDLQDMYPESKFYPKLKEKVSNKYPWVSFDPDSASFLHGLIKRTDFVVGKIIQTRIHRIMQFGFQDIFRSAGVSNRDIMEDLLGVESKYEEILDCYHYSRNLKVVKFDFLAIRMKNMTKLGIAYCCCLLFSLIVFLTEQRGRKKLKERKRRRRIRLRRRRGIRPMTVA